MTVGINIRYNLSPERKQNKNGNKRILQSFTALFIVGTNYFLSLPLNIEDMDM